MSDEQIQSIPDPQVETESLSLVLLVITRVDFEHACIAGLDSRGRWIRPMPVQIPEVDGEHARFAFASRYNVKLQGRPGEDSRPEDRKLVKEHFFMEPGEALPANEVERLCERSQDVDVDACFARERSAGLIRATAVRVYLQRGFQQRSFVRMVFTDASGQEFDWLVADLHFSDWAASEHQRHSNREAAEAAILKPLSESNLYLALTLTTPINRPRGVIRGCQPLVGGVHSFPHYASSPQREGRAAKHVLEPHER